MNTEQPNPQPTILRWHREAAQDIGNQLAQWGDTEIAAIIARHDPHRETLELLERAFEYVDEYAESKFFRDRVRNYLAAHGGGK